MNATVQRVREALDAHGVDGAIHTFAIPVPSAAAAAEQLGCPVGAIVNSLVFSAAGVPVLVLTSGAHRVDVARVARHLGVGRKQVRRADPALVLAATGQRVGGVAPVGIPARSPPSSTPGSTASTWCGPARGTSTRCSRSPAPNSSR